MRIKLPRKERKQNHWHCFPQRECHIFVFYVSLKVLLCASKHPSWRPTQGRLASWRVVDDGQAQTTSNSRNQVTAASVTLTLSAAQEGVISNKESPIKDLMELPATSLILCIPFQLNGRRHLCFRRNICKGMLYGTGFNDRLSLLLQS